ncbi:MAG: hemerythrin domain-containing protein [Byssovorax sp.]
MEPRPPLSLLEHDHVHLSRQIAALHAEIEALAALGTPIEPMADDIVQALVVLSEDLFEHFAREEEGLFALVTRLTPDLGAEVLDLIDAHDRICGAASRLVALKDRPPTQGTIDLAAALFKRLYEIYSEHSGKELALFAKVAARVGPEGQAELGALLAED